METRVAVISIIVENPEYEAKFNVYDAVQKKKAGE